MDKKKILIADDESRIRQLVKRFFGDAYIVLEAENGKEALHVATAQKPDLILMDIKMPMMAGFSACRHIKSNSTTKEIPVIMLTGLDIESYKKYGLELGADKYVTKPFSLQDLKEWP
jgi:DNA-binding response OmpR family regulator